MADDDDNDKAKKFAAAKAALPNEILGILSGRLQQPPYAETLANTMLGVSLGALTDLGKSDEYILSHCRDILTAIRRAKADPEALRAIEEIKGRIKNG